MSVPKRRSSDRWNGKLKAAGQIAIWIIALSGWAFTLGANARQVHINSTRLDRVEETGLRVIEQAAVGRQDVIAIRGELARLHDEIRELRLAISALSRND